MAYFCLRIFFLTSTLLLPLLGYKAELIVPLLTKTADKRFLQELIDRQMQFLAQYTRTMADIPTVVFHADHIPHLVEADGIEMAGDGFFEIDLARVVCLLDETIAPTIVVGTGKDTVFVVDNRGDFFARRVEIRQALCLHYGACLLGHIRQEDRQYLADFGFFIISKRCARIALDTAATTAFIQIAAEVLLKDI